jgi:hypothetical protein
MQHHLAAQRGGVDAVRVQATGQGLAALLEAFGQRALQDAQVVAVGNDLVLGVDGGDRVFQVEDGRERGLQHHVGHTGCIGLADRVRAVDDDLQVQAVVAQQQAAGRLGSAPVANELRRLLQGADALHHPAGPLPRGSPWPARGCRPPGALPRRGTGAQMRSPPHHAPGCRRRSCRDPPFRQWRRCRRARRTGCPSAHSPRSGRSGRSSPAPPAAVRLAAPVRRPRWRSRPARRRVRAPGSRWTAGSHGRRACRRSGRGGHGARRQAPAAAARARPAARRSSAPAHGRWRRSRPSRFRGGCRCRAAPPRR